MVSELKTQGRLAGNKYVVLDHIYVVKNHIYVVRNHIYVVSQTEHVAGRLADK